MHSPDMTQSRPKDRERGERVKKIRKEILKLRSQEELAERLSVTRGAVGNWELGGEMGIDAMAALSKLSGVPLDWIAYNKGTFTPTAANENVSGHLIAINRTVDQIPISGRVAANTWLDVGDTAIDYDSVEYVPSLSGYPAAWQFAYRVDGNCLNKVAKHNDVLVCLNIIASGDDVFEDDLVIVQRSRFGGQMIERTAKRVRRTSRGTELWPDSTDPAHQEPIALYDSSPEIEVQIIGKVLWILRRP
jgi:transcriptional regulator with XRE-family HTH domain